MDMEDIERVDRMSALPEPLLQHILSFLPLKQVVQVSVVSKTWQLAWLTFPILEFNCTLVQQFMQGNYGAEKRRKQLNFLHSVEKILRNRSKEMINIEKLTLGNYSTPFEFSSVIEGFVGYATECNVKELIIYFPPGDPPENNILFILPQTILCAKSIHVLDLGYCVIQSPTSVKLSSLRKLCLRGSLAADTVIESIVTQCPLIEDLTVESCFGFESLKLLGLHKLNDFTIRDNRDLKRLEMKAFNVTSVTILGIVIPVEINIGLCKNVKDLYFGMNSITDECICNQISQFPLLEHLGISACNELKSIKISSSSLKKLHIYSCKKLVEVKLETPYLSIFNYAGDVISFNLGGGFHFALLETNFCFFSENDRNDTQWYFKYIEILTKFCILSKVLNLKSRKGENAIFPEEVRQTKFPLFCGVKHLKFSIEMPPIIVGIKNIVDGLLWISPHVMTMLIACFNRDLNFSFEFKFIYKKQLIFEEGIAHSHCCKSVPVSCWRECMEKVEIVYTYGDQVKKYCFKGDEAWEEMDCLTELPTI